MRHIFFELLKEKMIQDESVFFLSGDTGFNLIEPLFELAPHRCINVGIAEQNLIGIAAGLCNAGYRPVCYAITNFIVHRCLEQIRDDICLHHYNILLVGTSTGFDNGGLGGTHHMLDDIGCLKPLPNINIYSPSGRKSMASVFQEAFLSQNSSFIRITKGDYIEADSVTCPNHFILHNPSADILVVSHGKMVQYCVEAAIWTPNISIFALDRIKPIDDFYLKKLFSEYSTVVVVEDNFSSGLFNSICQWFIENKILNTELHFIGPKEGYEMRIGNSTYLEGQHSLSPEKISRRINELIGHAPSNTSHVLI